MTEERSATRRRQAEKKLVVWFTNDERGLVLNKTNNRDHPRRLRRRHRRLGRQDHRRVSDDGRLPRQDGPGLRVRIPPPKQAQLPRNGRQRRSRQQPKLRHALPTQQRAAARRPSLQLRHRRSCSRLDPELDRDPVFDVDDLDDEIPF